MNKLTFRQRETIEKHLLTALKEIDSAKAIIYKTDECIKEGETLNNARTDIKRVLNKEFDTLARNKILEEINAKLF